MNLNLNSTNGPTDSAELQAAKVSGRLGGSSAPIKASIMDVILCPHCRHEVELSTAVAARLNDEVDEQLRVMITQARDQASREVQERLDLQMQSQQTELESLRGRLRAAQEVELEVVRRQRRLEEKEAELELEAARRLEEERAAIAKRTAEAVRAEYNGITEGLRVELEAVQARLQQAEGAELDLRRRQAEVERLREGLELEVRRRLDLERDSVADVARRQAEEHSALALEERDTQIRRLNEQIARLQRSADPRQSELEGESLEVYLKRSLERAFPADTIREVPRGEAGGDVIQSVRDASLCVCGTIMWETKVARRWTESWLEKTRRDQRTATAELAVIVSTALPAGVEAFVCRDGIWISAPWCAPALGSALRQTIIRVASMRAAATCRDDRLRAIQEYLTGTSFRLLAERLLAALSRLRQFAEQEERTVLRCWQKRKAALEDLAVAASQIIGDLEGATNCEIIGTEQPNAGSDDEPHPIESRNQPDII